MGKDWKKEFDDILKGRKGESASGAEDVPEAEEPEGIEAEAAPVEPIPDEPEGIEAEAAPSEPDEPVPIPEEPGQPARLAGIFEEPDTAETEYIEDVLEEAPPPVLVEPESELEELITHGPADDPRKRTGFGLAVEQMFHELVNQIGQVKEMARRKREEQEVIEADKEEREFIEEEDASFFAAVEKMFHDIRGNFTRRMNDLREQGKEVEDKLEKTRIALEVRQQELERLRHEMDAARARVGELEQEIARLRAEAVSKVDADYVHALEERLEDAYGLLKTIEETYLAVEGASF